MKRLLTIFVALLSFVVAEAQTQGYSIIIDEESFAPVQTDAMSGVAIDKIGKDTSQRPCARLKMRVNRMTATEIDQLKVMVIGGNVVVMKHYVAAEGNGLIVELTAKQPTRFYLHHDKYGDSNEVSLNLEGDKEYKLSAQLNVAYPIFVNCDVEGAEVYVDNLYKGTTDANYTLTVRDIAPGRHTLKVKYGSAVSEQDIEVTSENLAFRMNVNVAKSRPQYVVFQVVPRNAVVVVDKKNYVPDATGVVTLALHNGTYGYEVLADEYHPESGTFVVSGAKVEREVKLRPAHGWLTIADSGVLEDADIYVDNKYIGKTPIAKHQLASGVHSVMVVKELYHTHKADITIEDGKEQNYAPKLSADFATVTLDAGKGFDIYVNNELKGASPWTGRLATGAYIFEVRKEGHRPTILTQSIAATPAQQTYKLDAPTPIVGTLNIVSTPALAEVYVDGNLVGRTPLMYDTIIGDHEIEIKAKGYCTNKQSVTVAEGEFRDLNISLQEGSDQPAKVAKKYAVGDLIDVNGVKGVVFYMDDNVVKAVSVDSAELEWCTSTGLELEEKNANDENDGVKNMKKVKPRNGWGSKYPAFKWCADLGEGWYLPAYNELRDIWYEHSKINSTLRANGYSELASGSHLSSTEYNYSDACGLDIRKGDIRFLHKNYKFNVRAVVALSREDSSTIVEIAPQTETGENVVINNNGNNHSAKSYAVGELIDVNGVKGIVFYVDDSVVKAVSVESTELQWAAECKEYTYTSDDNDGMKNMKAIKKLRGWESTYPAFKWCADLGEGWYLPAKNELQAIYDLKETINSTLKANGYPELALDWHWSSTGSGQWEADCLNFSNGVWYWNYGRLFRYRTKNVHSVIALKKEIRLLSRLFQSKN